VEGLLAALRTLRPPTRKPTGCPPWPASTRRRRCASPAPAAACPCRPLLSGTGLAGFAGLARWKPIGLR